MIKLLFMAGSAREASLSKKIAKAAYKIALEKGVEAIFIDLRDFPMPIYDGDLEVNEGMPENAAKLKELFAGSDGYFIVTPEYNSFFPPLLKNVIDWMSRPDNRNIGNPYMDKVAAIAGASPGAMGGIRALPSFNTLLSKLGVHVVPTQVAVGNAASAIDENGNFADERQRAMITASIDQLIKTARALKS
ncbi:MAG: NAD(P)H-dependent oxidoreductase [Alphaproteobacteria bacterium]|nr:NAD(P)H-dependent oxidoreductase [Alphaproteobacteria bacterium]HPF46080.1 NAD(P)H-dependent oxidoreductase [Emcibacteraceae bacterium]HRW30951.1 NAD(P)H-dependent oxidoreductase [Emcibacteraceae bacterium]